MPTFLLFLNKNKGKNFYKTNQENIPQWFIAPLYSKVCAQVGGGESHDKRVRVCTGEEEWVKPGEYICILAVYFPFLKIFLIKKEK